MSSECLDTWPALAEDFHPDNSMLRWAQAVIRSWRPPANDTALAKTLSQGAFWEPDRAIEFVCRARRLRLPDPSWPAEPRDEAVD
jgi:hypothetical protein